MYIEESYIDKLCIDKLTSLNEKMDNLIQEVAEIKQELKKQIVKSNEHDDEHEEFIRVRIF